MNPPLPEWEQVLSTAAHMLPNLAEYKKLDPKWHQWSAVKAACVSAAMVIFDHASLRNTQRNTQPNTQAR